MNEASKNYRRRSDNDDFAKFFSGIGIDIGCGSDPVVPWAHRWDKAEGDAQLMAGVDDEKYDFVHSSHCLEHLAKPQLALQHWWRILKPGGYLIVTVPDFALYEKFHRPSRFNPEHKTFFTIATMPLFALALKNAQILRLQINDEGFDYSDRESDQTRKGAQAEIEMILRKLKDPFWAGGSK